MHVLVAGAHGQVARLLTPLLVADGHLVRGLVRDPAHRSDVEDDGAEAVVCDLEAAPDGALDGAVTGADAVVFAAGAGPGSGAARKWTVDHGAAKRLVDASRRLGVRRFVMISAMGTDDPPADDSVFSVYLQAKARADADLRAAGLDHTIVRPGRLVDDAPTGAVAVGHRVGRAGITRGDVAAVVAAVLVEPRTHGRTFEVVNGPTPVAEAVAAVGDLPVDPPA